MATWAPSLTDVGGCIPTRTVNVNLPGSTEYLNTFTSDTRPTGLQAQAKIDQAVADVELAVASIPTELEDAAKNAAMWRAAADIELAYPDRNADANVYAALDARARYEWGLFIDAANSGGTGDGQLPYFSFPAPPSWADRNDI